MFRIRVTWTKMETERVDSPRNYLKTNAIDFSFGCVHVSAKAAQTQNNP